MTARSGSHDAAYVARERARELLTGMGYDEAATESLLSKEEWDAFRPWAEEEFVVTNPVRAGRDRVRSSLVPGLLLAWAENERAREGGVRLFEAAQVCVRDKNDVGSKELVAALHGDGFYLLKGDLEEFLARLGVEGPEFRPEAFPALDPTCSAVVRAGGKDLGWVGLCSEELARAFCLRGRPCLFELDLGGVMKAATLRRAFRPLPEYPGIARDVALVVDDSLAWSDVRRVVLDGAHEWMGEPDFLSLYKGKVLPAGKKSLAFRVVYRSPKKTLSDEDVAPVHGALVARLKDSVGAVLRGEEG
jgi:phenylalanyl-tRNA synthetase beta chain